MYEDDEPVDFERQERAKQWAENKRRVEAQGLRTGHFTGRCKRCGSSNLWDDNLAYGCNNCGAIYV